jgi:glycosyltransferase involved in cell wall biosynthesis
MHIAIVGPANPHEFETDLEAAGPFPAGLGGTPVNGLVRSLLDLGHTVSLFTASPSQEKTWRASGPRLNIIAVPYRTRARDRGLDLFRGERRAIAKELEKCNADVFHAHWTYEFALACKDARVGPLLVTAHDAPLTILRHMPDGYRLIRTLMAFRARISIKNLTTVTPHLAARWRKEMLFRRPIAIITNPMPKLDLPEVPDTRKAVILDVANASKLKNVRALIIAFAAVREVHSDAELRLVGGGLGKYGPVAQWATSHGLAVGVAFLGPLDREAIALQYAEATIFCHASLEEAQGMCLIEAMSASIPIVAGRNSGGVGWTLFDGAGGTLVNVRSSEEIAAAIESILLHKQAFAAKAQVAKALSSSRYSGNRIASQYVDEYKRIIALSEHGPLQGHARREPRSRVHAISVGPSGRTVN